MHPLPFQEPDTIPRGGAGSYASRVRLRER